MTRIVSYAPTLLDPLVRYWNREFVGMRNFFPVDAAALRSRIIGKANGVEGFEPEGLLIALEGEEPVGLCHAGARPELVCRALYGDWSGGSEGYVGLIHVASAFRRRGIGRRLLERARGYLAGTARVILDGQCFNPFYGNSEGPFTPFWGTTEGISLPWQDDGSRAALERLGFAPRYRGVTLAVRLDGAAVRGAVDPSRPGPSYAFPHRDGSIIELGPVSRAPRVPLAAGSFLSLYAVRADTVIGVVIAFEMAEVAPDMAGIYELRVLPEERGRGVARGLLNRLARLLAERGKRRMEVLTVPDLSPGAVELYRSMGYEEVAQWAVY